MAQFLRGLAESFPTMLLWTALLGVGATGVTSGLPKLVAKLYPADRVGSASSVYLVSSYGGTAAAFGLGRPVVGLVFAVGEIGGFLDPALVGPLREATGTYAAGIASFSCGGVLVVAAGAAKDL